MNRLTFSGVMYGENITLNRVQKKTAKKLFTQGETIYLQSSNFVPFGVWTQAIPIKRNEDGILRKFEDIVNSFEYYNTSYEQGYYTSFYIKQIF